MGLASERQPSGRAVVPIVSTVQPRPGVPAGGGFIPIDKPQPAGYKGHVPAISLKISPQDGAAGDEDQWPGRAGEGEPQHEVTLEGDANGPLPGPLGRSYEPGAIHVFPPSTNLTTVRHTES